MTMLHVQASMVDKSNNINSNYFHLFVYPETNKFIVIAERDYIFLKVPIFSP